MVQQTKGRSHRPHRHQSWGGRDVG